MKLHLYHYPNCSTCKKARKFLDQQGHKHALTDLVAEPIALDRLKDLYKRSGLPLSRFFNTSGESYRNGDFKTRIKTMSEAEQLSALSKDGKLVKRPILDAGSFVLVGFDEKAYAEKLG
ncbi:MAG TPA: Spx/MgsR family RNA polymerase-binding regulatory protein [Polyangiales bacterium]|nr:Spx/MgsR family RNA polymerase-binding regulatory protein [Polyangiales bacterium]